MTEQFKDEVSRDDLAQLLDSLKYRPVATTAAQLRLAAATIEAQMGVIENLRKSFSEHCQDCCCARSWRALGITEYTGKSIPEHIDLLRAALPVWRSIETAPKDGTPFLCGFWDRTRSNYFWITKAHWANGAIDGGWDGAREPIELVKAGYWMPLPAAPELVEAASHG